MKDRKEWFSLIEAYNASGLTQRAFCIQEDIPLGSFKWQLRRSRRDGVAVDGFALLSVCAPSLTVDASTNGTGSLEVHLPSGIFLRFDGDAVPRCLQDLVMLLRS